MSKLTKPIRRETEATVFERSQARNIIIILEPARDGARIGFKIKGSRDIYRLPVGSLYTRAVEHHLQKVERRAKKIAKEENKRITAARSQAKKELKEDLR